MSRQFHQHTTTSHFLSSIDYEPKNHKVDMNLHSSIGNMERTPSQAPRE